jgi:acyl dehydratase
MDVGDRFERTVRWTPEEVVAFADLTGDANPLHHDAEYSRGTRFGGLIASGAQTVAYLMSLCASQTSVDAPGVGLEFNFKLLGPAKPDDDILLRWEVTSVEASERPAGTIVALRGEAVAGNGKPILSAAARTLLVEKL